MSVSDLDRLAALLYNKPLATYSRKLLPHERSAGMMSTGSRFLRWHELNRAQQDRVRAELLTVLAEAGLRFEESAPRRWL